MLLKFRRLLGIGFLFFLILISGLSQAQLRLDTLNWAPPVDIPIFLSGNFAELRSGHFHAGIDIKTQGHEGFKVYAVNDGYISRIKVAPDGYGQSIYIMHPDGYTSVYGHLREFNIQIGKYVRQKQYEKERFAVDLFLNPEDMPVKKGDIIGLSGNTGSSGGPHVHFEIRDTRNSNPMNGLFLGFKIEDNIPPQIYTLYVYPCATGSQVDGQNNKLAVTLNPKNGKYKPAKSDTIVVAGITGLGIKADDFLNSSANRCGVYNFRMYLDDSLAFDMCFDGFSFSETHYVSSMLDYAEYIRNKVKAYKLYIEPNNKLSVYSDRSKNGLFTIQPGKVTKVRIEAIDAYGNSSVTETYLKGTAKKTAVKPKDGNQLIGWQNAFAFDTLGIVVNFEKETFFDSIRFSFKADTTIPKKVFSYTYQIGSELIPLDKSFTMRIKCRNYNPELTSKLLVVQMGSEKDSPLSSTFDNGFLTAVSSQLGSFKVAIDTIAPTIKPVCTQVSPDDSTKTIRMKGLNFIVEDNLSGINYYRGTINGQWVLFRYDPKNKMLGFEPDEYLKKADHYQLDLKVTDERGNVATFTKTYSGDSL